MAVASYSRERRANRGSTTSAVSCTAPPSAATSARSARSGSETRKDRPRAHGYDDSMVVTGMLEALLRDSFPDASELAVEDRTGGGDHFQVTVASGRFDGLSLVEQHRLVYEALAEPLADGSIHELRIKTRGIA